MTETAFNRRYDEMHEAKPFHDGKFTSWVEKADDTHPYHFRDGVTIFVTAENLTPDDDFVTSRQSDRPIGGM